MPISDDQALSAISELVAWGKVHYRDRTFNKDIFIPTRPGLLYVVHQGAIRLIGRSTNSLDESGDTISPVLLSLVGENRPFEIAAQSTFVFEAYAQIDQTSVIWLYWNELTQWPTLHLTILEAFHRHYQSQLIWVNALGQKSTLERLLSFLALLMAEYGQPVAEGYCFPYPLTHGQIGNAIRATRVTITRLMVRLRQQEIIFLKDDLICLERRTFQQYKPLRPQ
ncbi:MAG: Crp/Fnr family transcriptional regulator [Snowella sp.]|nr:Crp/Fnr family transcriptional regulator [Snowella sp.]